MCLYVNYINFKHNYTDMTEDESAENEIAIKTWSTCDLGIILLMAVVVVATLYNFFFTIGWIQFVERNIIIVPAIIGLIMQSSLHFKRSALKLAAASSYINIVERMALNNVITTNLVVQRMAMTIMSFTVETYSTSVAAIMYVVKKPIIAWYICNVLMSIDGFTKYYLTCYPRTIRAAYLSLMILTVSFNHKKMARKIILLALFICASIINICCCVVLMLNNVSLFSLISPNGIYVMIFCFSFLHYLNSNELVYFAVALSITTFTYDFVLVPVDIVDLLLYLLSYLVPEVYLLALFLYTSRA